MLFAKQRLLHKPEEGQYGDCFRTALACMLNLAPEEVPHFLHDDPSSEVFWSRANEWLLARGLKLFNVPFKADLDDVLATMKAQNPGVYYLLAGESPRGTAHQVIALDDAIIHDPHPDGGGLVGPVPYDGMYWVNVLVPTPIHVAE